MKTVVILLNRFFDVLWAPLSKTPILIDIIVISAISAIVFLVIFKKTSNQEMIRHYKNKMLAHILQIRLYKDQPIVVIKSILSILGYNLIYLRHTLVPLIVLFLPILVISVQINNRYGYSPLEEHKPFIIRADIVKGILPNIGSSPEKILFETSRGILVETPPMMLESEASILWRTRVVNSGESGQFCRIAIDGTVATLEKEIVTTMTKQRFSPERRKWHPRNFLVSNAEDFISETSPFEAISVYYDRATYPFLAWNADPIVLYFILTLVFGLVFKPILRVNI